MKNLRQFQVPSEKPITLVSTTSNPGEKDTRGAITLPWPVTHISDNTSKCEGNIVKAKEKKRKREKEKKRKREKGKRAKEKKKYLSVL